MEGDQYKFQIRIRTTAEEGTVLPSAWGWTDIAGLNSIRDDFRQMLMDQPGEGAISFNSQDGIVIINTARILFVDIYVPEIDWEEIDNAEQNQA